MNVNDSLSGFTLEQRKWMIARLLTTSDAAAARAIKVHPSTVCRWPEKPEIDKALERLLEDPKGQVMVILMDALAEAAKVKVSGLRSRREQVRQSAAEQIMDRVLGKSTQKQEVNSLVKNLDLSTLSDSQLERLASGEDVLSVLTTQGGG